MARYQKFIDVDVLTEARARIGHLYDLFDSVVVSFSGGKDSLAVLHLVREVAAERGIEHVDAVFYDEELIPDVVIDFVEAYRAEPWLRLDWLAVPLQSNKYILGRSVKYLQWDPGRRHIRPIPEHALTLDKLGLPADTEMSQYDVNTLIANRHRGRVAIVTGIRASESLMRLRASLNKLSENWINATSTTKASLCKPLFDWQENDIFRYFYDRGIRYCPIYDAQLYTGQRLRVSSPLHAESAKRFGYLRQWTPTFYDQLTDLFPEMLVQERYFAEFDQDTLLEQYADDLDGVSRWIEDNVDDPTQLALARKRLKAVRVRARSKPEAYKPRYVLKQFVSGAYKREILPRNR